MTASSLTDEQTSVWPQRRVGYTATTDMPGLYFMLLMAKEPSGAKPGSQLDTQAARVASLERASWALHM